MSVYYKKNDKIWIINVKKEPSTEKVRNRYTKIEGSIKAKARFDR